MEGLALTYIVTKNQKANEGYFEGWHCPDNGAIKDPQKQADWKRDKKIKEMDSCRLACVNKIAGWCFVNINNPDHSSPGSVSNDEKVLLTDLAKKINECDSDIWLKNAKNYSVPFLLKRFIANGVAVPKVLRPLYQSEYKHGFKTRDTNDIIGSHSQSCEETMTSIDEDYFLVTGEYLKSGCDVRLCVEMMEKGDQTAIVELTTHLRLQAKKLATYIRAATQVAGV